MSTAAASSPDPTAAPRSRAVHRIHLALLAAAALNCVVALQVIFLRAPVESTMGLVQKIFYFHVPAAYGMYLGALACLVGSVGYLARRTLRWDALAKAGGELAVVMGTMVMVSGPLWARQAWGRYWTWDPRLITLLLSVLIYVSYVMLRGYAGRTDAVRRFAAALGVLGAAMLPLVHFSVQVWHATHPRVITRGGGGLGHFDMKVALALGFATFTLLVIVLVWHRARLYLSECRLAALEHEAIQLGIADD